MSTQGAAIDERDRAFIEPLPKIAGLQLRPFSAGTLTLCRELGLTVVLGGSEATEADKQKQLVTLLFIQTQPLQRVLEAVKVHRKDPQAFLDDYLLPFELELPVASLPKVIGELNEVFAAIAAADFDVAPGAKGRDPNS